MTDIELTFVADLDQGSRTRIAYAVGAGREAILVLTDEPDDLHPSRTTFQGAADGVFPRTRPLRPLAAEVLVHDGRYEWRMAVDRLDIAHPFVQLLPNDEVLFVGARCRRFRDGRVEPNARVVGTDGGLRREFTLGDGIADVQATGTGDVWVSYFDEGVFGNYGWGGSGRAAPIGRCGLLRADPFGHITWRFTPPPKANMIVDCYALNVDSDTAWAYYYTDFPLVRTAQPSRTSSPIATD